METHFADSIEVLHNKLEELVPDGIVDMCVLSSFLHSDPSRTCTLNLRRNLRGASDLRLSRYFADFAPKPECVFPFFVRTKVRTDTFPPSQRLS